jgi:hypothetical protein
LDSIQRIVGPTRPFLLGAAKLTGSPLASYRKRVWQPRIRNEGTRACDFAPELIEYGLSPKVLSLAIEQLSSEEDLDFSCKLKTVPTIGLYRKLHQYLTKHLNLPKVVIGRFYCAFDCNFQEKGSRADNIYRFVDTIVSSKRSFGDLMLYNVPVRKSTKTMLKQCSKEIEDRMYKIKKEM